MLAAWFWGGPLDGETRNLQRFHPEYLVPMPEKLWTVRLSEDQSQLEIRVGVYRAEYRFYKGPEPWVIYTWKGAT